MRKRKTSYRDADELPPVAVLRVRAPDSSGDLWADPVEWEGKGTAPKILMVLKPTDPALGEGDRVLARLEMVKGQEHDYAARVIRQIGTNPQRIVGIFRKGSEGGRIVPIDKGADRQWVVPAEDTTFSSIMTEPMSFAPYRRPTWPMWGPIVTQLEPMDQMLSR